MGQTGVVDKVTLGPDDAPRAARRAVHKCCMQAGASEDCARSTELATSEVVTNALRHSSGQVLFGVDCDGPTVRVEVGDDNRSHPTLGEGGDHQEGGRGMLIVEALASDWGVDDHADGGKTVWFEVPVEAGTPPDDAEPARGLE